MAATTSSRAIALPGLSLTMVAKTLRSRRNSESSAVRVWLIAAGHQYERELQRHHHVEHCAMQVERCHNTAYAFDQQNFAALLQRALAIFHDAVDIDGAAFALRRDVGGDGGAKAPG